MWEKIWTFIKSGRLSEPSTYAGISAIIIPVYSLLGRPLVDDSGNLITGTILTEMIASPVGSIALGIIGISGLIAIFTREGPKE
jgi:hypothetical protein